MVGVNKNDDIPDFDKSLLSTVDKKSTCHVLDTTKYVYLYNMYFLYSVAVFIMIHNMLLSTVQDHVQPNLGMCCGMCHPDFWDV